MKDMPGKNNLFIDLLSSCFFSCFPSRVSKGKFYVFVKKNMNNLILCKEN